MRQSGLLAAAAIFALEHNVDRLAQDHANAKAFARGISAVRGLRPHVSAEETPTNMVFFHVDPSIGTAQALCARLESKGVRMMGLDPQRVRAVTHRDVDAAGIERAVREVAAAVQVK